MTVGVCLQNGVSRQIEAPSRIWGEGKCLQFRGSSGEDVGENAIVLVPMPIGGPRGASDADVLLVPMPIVWFFIGSDANRRPREGSRCRFLLVPMPIGSPRGLLMHL